MVLWFLGCNSLSALTDPADLVVVADQIIEIGSGRIRAIHAPDADAPLAIGPSTTVLRAKHVTAGFVDAHGHPDGLGAKLAELDLSGARSYEETLERIRNIPNGNGWLVGRGWNQERWTDAPPGGWPLATDLDKLQPGRPVVLSRADGHALWVSPRALLMSNIDSTTLEPSNGRILRDEIGRPTGVLIDGATELVRVPAPSPEEQRRRLQSALVLIAAKGLTGVHVMGCDDATLAILTDLARSERLPIRLWIYATPDSVAAKRLLEAGPWREPEDSDGDRRLAIVGIKIIADGALGSRGALLSQPYSDEPGHVGTAVTDPAVVRDLTMRALAAGVQVAVHAIGDRAVRETLDTFAAARAAHPDKRDIPLRVEHAQVVDPADRSRFAELSVIASMQPTHATSDAPWAEDRLGAERIFNAYAWRSLSDAGAVLAFGSDFPVEAVDPALGIAAATTRGGWHTEQALTLEQTLAAFTSGAAMAVGEGDLGTLDVGARADLTLWEETKDDIPLWRAIGTIVGGELVAGGAPQ